MLNAMEREHRLPKEERNALLLFFSKENQELKQELAKKDRYIAELEEKISQLRRNMGYVDFDKIG